MPYLIDGHNLIAKLPDLSLSDPHDETKLVNKLRSFAARTKKRCTVVFDRGLPGGKSTLSNHMVEVIFSTAYHTTADHVIIERIKKTPDPKGWTVITSDETVLGCALAYQMRGMRCHEFIPMLNQTPAKADLGAWEHVYVKPNEVAEFLMLFNQHSAPPPEVKPMLPTKPVAQPEPPIAIEARVAPKPKPSPTAPRPKPPKRPKPHNDSDEKGLHDNDMDFWLSVFGE